MSVWVSQINRDRIGICIWFYGGAIAENVVFWGVIFRDGQVYDNFGNNLACLASLWRTLVQYRPRSSYSASDSGRMSS